MAAITPWLMVRPLPTNGVVEVIQTGQADGVLTLRASPDLRVWAPIATMHGTNFNFLDLGSRELPNRFYHVNARPRTTSDDWRNQATWQNDTFVADASGPEEVRWIKFAIVTNEPLRVYFQDSAKYLFHYDFAVARIAQFNGMTRQQFDAVSLRRTGQQVLLGSVLLPPPSAQATDVGIQFVGLEPYPREQVRQWFELVKSTIVPRDQMAVFYMPVYEQAAAAEADRTWFEANGVPISSADRWLQGNVSYSTGWAIGRLTYVPSGGIRAAYADGTLRPEDILLTDGVPAEIPPLAGIITFKSSTPNSHVAILARSYGVPFVFISDPVERARIQQLAGKDVILRVYGSNTGRTDVRVVELDPAIEPATRQELLDLKLPKPIEFMPKTSFGAISSPVTNMVPADAKFFGGKAANYGLLMRRVPSNSVPAIAFSFDLWDDFMSQPIATTNETLGAEIAARLARHSYPPNVALLRADLTGVRDLITRTAFFNTSQRQAILGVLTNAGIFDPNRKVRFRSSTNLEDGETFTGAGLYDSYSGCIVDETDGDTTGPSHCDADDVNERGVFQAIQRVYASFYNENAFIERLRHRVDETKVGIAVLVHHSFPDEEELANGVATVRRDGTFFSGDLVTQLGANSVANPDGNSQPEIVTFTKFSFGTYPNFQQRSSLVPLGGYVLKWEDEYKELIGYLTAVADAYAQLAGRSSFVLDFEYKKIAPGKLIVKQVRELPQPGQTRTITPFLLNEGQANLCVFQGEYGNVFSNHRLKSRWQLGSRNLRLTETALELPIYTDTTLEYVEANALRTMPGPLSSWPDFSHSAADEMLTDRWRFGEGAAARQYELITTNVRRLVSESESPILFLSDFYFSVGVTYSEPVLIVDYFGNAEMTTNDSVRLWPCPQRRTDDIPQTRTFTAGARRIVTKFYWPKPPGFSAGYTAPVIAWEETRIEGLTSQPIMLRGEYSQTYRPEHHNFGEHFIFDPRLEPGIPTAVLQELAAADIQLVYVHWDGEIARIRALGANGELRDL